MLGDTPAQVMWIDVATTDSGAAEFVNANNLPLPWYEFVSRDERRSFGISGWPTVVLINDGLVSQVELPWRPEQILEADTRCNSTDATEMVPQ